MQLGEAIVVFPDWFQLRFVENNGAAFGMHIASGGGFDWGKLLLGIFRIGLAGALAWLIVHLVRHRRGTPRGSLVGTVLIPLVSWNGVPRWLQFLVDGNNYFFGAIFNLADAYISVAVVYLLLFQYKFLNK